MIDSRKGREKDRMNIKDVQDESDMLQGNIRRIFLTDDAAELIEMYEVAKERIERIYEYHHARLCEEVQNGE